MKILDANLLLYAVNADLPSHRRAKRWLEDSLSGSETIGFAWVVLLAFIRIATRPGVFGHPLSPETAMDVVDEWLSQPCATIVSPGERHLAIFRSLISSLGTAGNLTSGAHLAALALQHGAELCSSDRDFARFPGLRWRNPLA